MTSQIGAVVLLSGGADSCIALFDQRETWNRAPLITLAFDYGQRQRCELRAAREISTLAGAEHFEIQLDLRGAIPSALTTGGEIATREDGLPNTFVPGRNAFFLSVAAGVAKARGISMIVIGASEADFSGYPDCRRRFFDRMEDALQSGVDDQALTIELPWLLTSKAETVRIARGLPGCWEALARSWTCYDPQEDGLAPARPPWGAAGHVETKWRPCGVCPACVLRAKGFADAGEIDPALEVKPPRFPISQQSGALARKNTTRRR